MFISLFACDIEDLQTNEQVRRITHLLVSIGWIVFIRGDRPYPRPAIFRNFKLVVLLFIGIVLKDFQRSRFEWIGEFLKQDLIDSSRRIDCVSGIVAGRRCPRKERGNGRNGHHCSGFCRFRHRDTLRD